MAAIVIRAVTVLETVAVTLLVLVVTLLVLQQSHIYQSTLWLLQQLLPHLFQLLLQASSLLYLNMYIISFMFRFMPFTEPQLFWML